jgi:putative transposase
MARLPRLSLARVAHLVLLRGHNGETVFRDDQDRHTFLEALRAAFEREQVALHAYALLTDRSWLLCTPEHDQGLSRAMQSLGRRFAAAFNRRHQRSGSLWDGRYRATVVESGRTLLGFDGPMQLRDIAEYWALGNTPFDRATAYRALLNESARPAQVERIVAAVQKGWALGSSEFVEALRLRTTRPLQPRRRGRPRLR